MKWVGLTGGIASGKSTVKKLIEGRGYRVIDADLIAHALTQVRATGYQRIVSQFGNDFLYPDQSINRSMLAALIFNDVEKKLELENILHPLIQAEVLRQKEISRKNGDAICFYDVPLLYEKNLAHQFDSVIVVWCDADVQRARLALRNNLTEDQVLVRIKSQMRMAPKIKNANHCLDNSTDFASLDKQVDRLFGLLSSLSQGVSS